MAQNQDPNTPRNDGTEQAEISTNSSVRTAGQAWVNAAADSVVANRAWTISRIDSTLGSIA